MYCVIDCLISELKKRIDVYKSIKIQSIQVQGYIQGIEDSISVLKKEKQLLIDIDKEMDKIK